MTDYTEQIESCIECDKCREICPICVVSDKEVYSPDNKIKLLTKVENNEPLDKDELDSIYLCTRCKACDDVCPSNIDITGIIQYERSLIAKQGREPQKTSHISNNISTKYNPKGLDNEGRMASWVTEDLEFSDDPSLAYMAGCWVAFKNIGIAQDTIRILNACGIKPKILSEELCCGLFLIDNGHMDEAKELAKKYTLYVESQGVKRLLVSCPSCYGVLKNVYPLLYREPKYEVVHALEFFKNLYDEGKIQFNKESGTVMLKDACPMVAMYDIPRELLGEIGFKFTEPFNKERFCCGAPAGVKPNYPEIANKIAAVSFDKAGDSDKIVTYCPFCLHHFDGVKEEMNINMPVEDISHIIWEAMKK